VLLLEGEGRTTVGSMGPSKSAAASAAAAEEERKAEREVVVWCVAVVMLVVGWVLEKGSNVLLVLHSAWLPPLGLALLLLLLLLLVVVVLVGVVAVGSAPKFSSSKEGLRTVGRGEVM